MKEVDPPAPTSIGAGGSLFRLGGKRKLGVMLSLLMLGSGLTVTAANARGGGNRSPNVLTDQPFTPMNLETRSANNSPALVADPTEPKFVALATRLDAPQFSCALRVSGDAGRTWWPVQPVTKLPPGAERCYAPEVAFDRTGKLYYLFVGLQGAGNEPMGAFISSSSNRGRTFSPPRRVLGPSNFGVRMAIDLSRGRKGRMHLVWIQATSDPAGGFGPPPNPILSAYSDNGGKSFSRPVQVSDANRERVVAPALALGFGGDVHVAYYDLQKDIRDYAGLEGPTWDGAWSLVVSTSRNGGRTFTSGVEVDSEIVPPERVMLIFTMSPPALASGPAGRVYVSWTDARRGDWDALLKESEDGGQTWSPLRRLNDDPEGNGRNQYLPRLSVSSSGRVDAVFYDRRRDPANLFNDVFSTFSTDGAVSFSRNRRLTKRSFSSMVGQQYAVASAGALVEFGSRLALISQGSRAVAAWTDTRNASAQRFTTEQDIFGTTIQGLPQPGGTPAVWAGVVLLFAGLGVLIWTFAGHRGAAAGRKRGLIAYPVALALLAACRASADPGVPPSVPTTEIKMTEFRFHFIKPASAGPVIFKMSNEGTLRHNLTLLALPPDFPPLAKQIHGSERRPIVPLAGSPGQEPGATESFAVDLLPGRYGLICSLIERTTEQTHAVKGMFSEFRITPSGGPAVGAGAK